VLYDSASREHAPIEKNYLKTPPPCDTRTIKQPFQVSAHPALR